MFVGVSQLEYARICLDAEPGLNAYYATGAHLSVTSGRLAYTFGLRGPAMTGGLPLGLLFVCSPKQFLYIVGTRPAC